MSQRFQFHLCDTFLFTISPRHINGNYFCWGFAARFTLLHALERGSLPAALKALALAAPAAQSAQTLSETLLTVAVAQSRVVSTNAANNLITIITDV